MSARSQRSLEPQLRQDNKDLSHHTSLIMHMTWMTLALTLVTALALTLVGAPLLVTLLLLPLVLTGIITLLAVKRLRTGQHFTQQEIQRLVNNSHDLEKECGELEFRTSKDVSDLDYHARFLQTTIDIMSSIYSAINRSVENLDHVLAESVNLIIERFNYSTVNIFITETYLKQESDLTGDAIVSDRLMLRATNNQTGRQLIEDAFSLTLDQENCVTTAARTRSPIFVEDFHPVPPYLESTDSPFTKSEIAVPLILEERLLGVLDLQGSMTFPLRRDDSQMLQSLANQLSIAIENASVLLSNCKNQQAMEQVHGTFTQGIRQNAFRSRTDRGYRVGPSGEPIPVNENWPPLMIEARESGKIVFGHPVAEANTLAVPVKIRNQIAGVVRLSKPAERGKWLPEEVALVERLCDRMSAALESARLFEETRRTAEREHLTGEITARMRSTNDPQAVLQIAARELRKALRADRTQLLVQTAVVHSPKADEADAVNHAGDQP